METFTITKISKRFDCIWQLFVIFQILNMKNDAELLKMTEYKIKIIHYLKKVVEMKNKTNS